MGLTRVVGVVSLWKNTPLPNEGRFEAHHDKKMDSSDSVSAEGSTGDVELDSDSSTSAVPVSSRALLQDSDVEEGGEVHPVSKRVEQDLFGDDSDDNDGGHGDDLSLDKDEDSGREGENSRREDEDSRREDEDSGREDEDSGREEEGEGYPPAKKPRIDEEEDEAAGGDSSDRLDLEDISDEEREDEGVGGLEVGQSQAVEGTRVEGEEEEEEEEKEEAGENAAEKEEDGEKEGGEAEGGSDDEESEGEEEEERVQLQEEIAELGGVGEAGEEEEGDQQEADNSDEEPMEERKFEGMSDWDLMMQKRKAAMERTRRRRRGDGDDTIHDDTAMALIQKMKDAAEQDRQLNLARKAATKKIQFLPTIMSYIKKAALQTIFIECGVLTAFAEWLAPLPDHSLPHLKIRESILDTLKSFPTPDSAILKSSKIGKAVMLVYQHPKETRKNKEKAGKLINEWARPIFGLASDFKMMTREEREKQDYANLSQEARRRISTGERRNSHDNDSEQPQKPGDKGWVGRARVPMPSTKGYVVRPKWNVEQDYHKKGSGKKTLNRYEKHLRKKKQEQVQKSSTHAVSISVEGRHMPL